MAELNYFLLDVFTTEQFGGNPLAVFPRGDDVSTEVMQSIAQELNLSETTFVQRPTRSDSDCTVRIFTPKREIPMAGHPTLGTAYAILKHGLFEPLTTGRLVFDEGVGPVAVDYQEGPSNLFMHQPLPVFSDLLERAAVARILSLNDDEIAESSPIQVVSCGVPLIFVPVKSLTAIRRCKVRSDLLEAELGNLETQEIFVFTQQTELPESDVHCRMFAPRFGVPEDPATGGAHGPLGSYLVKYGLSDGSRILSEQGYEMGRPSKITVRIVRTNGEISDVLVGGDCVEVGQGALRVHDP